MKTSPLKTETADEMREYAKWQCYYSHLKTLCKIDTVFKILRPKLIGPLDKPISIPSPVTIKHGTIDLILMMLNDTGFCPNALDVDYLMGFILEQLKNAVSEFVEVMTLLVGKTTTPRGKIAIPSDSSQEHLSGSPHYASADSDVESDGSISICRMSLVPSGGPFLKDKIGRARIEAFKEKAKLDTQPRSTGAPTGLIDQEVDYLSRFFSTAIKTYETDQRTAQRMNRQPTPHSDQRSFLQPPQENNNMPDVDMESVGSNAYNQIHRRAEYDTDDLWMSELRQLQVAAIGLTTGASAVTQRIRMSAMSELKELSGKDWEEDRARSWMGKVKLALLQD